ncbi:hypothetical protein PVAG01_09806 [Phlyctema vagabunda]|uniref:Uncharacterized protein n=1 Tax=Phlyctema vagabunda TaxID=108571 RepID=A0ABR4P472_9HELO
MDRRFASESFENLLPRADVPASQCYTPAGVVVTSDLVPCNAVVAADGQGSMCCSMGQGSQNDTCHPTGLCKNGGLFFRDFCSDPTWNSPYCLKDVCMDDNDFGSSTSYARMFSCGDNDSGAPTFCCGEGRDETCCQNSTAVFAMASPLIRVNGTVGFASTITITHTATATGTAASAGVTPSGESSNSTASLASCSQSPAAKNAAIGLGAGLGAVLLASAVAFFLLRRKWKGGPRQDYGSMDSSVGGANMQAYGPPKDGWNNYHEAPGSVPHTAELSSTR